MGWFFGCFGGSSKKDRKHQAPVSPLPKQQKPSSVAPRLPLAPSSAIPIKKTFPVRDGPSTEDLFTVRQVSSSAPVRHIQGGYLHGAAGVPLPAEKEEKPGPWHQLDDLEEELNDLSKQIKRDSHDAENIREEVHCLKSCGSLAKSPAQLKSHQQVHHQQSCVQEERWRSWLAPAGPSLARTPEKNFRLEGLKVALCQPTPAKENHGSLLAVQAPIQSKNLRQSTMQHKTQANVQEDGFAPIKESDARISLSPTRFRQKDQLLQGSSHCNAGTTNSKANPDMSNAPLERPYDNPIQTHWSLCGTEGTLLTKAIENESASMKKRRLAVNANSAQSPQLSKQQSEENVNSGQQYHSLLGQKRLKVAPSSEQVEGEMKSSLLQENPVPMHFFRCDSLSPIVESGTVNEESESSDTEGTPQGPFDQQQSSYNSVSQRTSQSPSLRQSPASQAKSVTFATYDEGYTTDELSYSPAAKYSEESYTNSTCINDANEEDDLETASYFPSTDSEETLSDLSPERCYSPPVSPSHVTSNVFRTVSSSGTTVEMQTARFTSIQHSSANGGRKKQYVSRYGCEEDERSDDENDLFTDALSHVSTEYSEREYRKWHSRTESMDSVSAQMAHVTDAIETPPKQSDWVSTPNINIQGKRTSRIRNKPASSVLTPVENVSQWKQLKETDHQNQTMDRKPGSDGSRKYTSKRVENIGAENLKAETGDENKILPWTSPRKDNGQLKITSQNNGPISVNTSLSHWAAGLEPEAAHVNVNASLSHWGITSRADTINTTTVDQSSSHRGTRSCEPEPVRVDMSLSHWLNFSSKQQILIGTSSNSSSSGENGVESRAPQPDSQISHIAKQTERRQPLMYAASERPILGAVSGESGGNVRSGGNVKPRSPWDGKGTPNATAKYMEDQRVKWHSTPFEQSLENALDKQGILLQKKLFAATPIAS